MAVLSSLTACRGAVLLSNGTVPLMFVYGMYKSVIAVSFESDDGTEPEILVLPRFTIFNLLREDSSLGILPDTEVSFIHLCAHIISADKKVEIRSMNPRAKDIP